MEDFGFGGDEFLIGDCMEDWALDLDPELDDFDDDDEVYWTGDLNEWPEQ